MVKYLGKQYHVICMLHTYISAVNNSILFCNIGTIENHPASFKLAHNVVFQV